LKPVAIQPPNCRPYLVNFDCFVDTAFRIGGAFSIAMGFKTHRYPVIAFAIFKSDFRKDRTQGRRIKIVLSLLNWRAENALVFHFFTRNTRQIVKHADYQLLPFFWQL